MPDIANRLSKEQRLAALLRRAIGRNRAALLASLGTPPDVANVPDSLWSNIEVEIQADTERALAILFLLAMSEMGSTFDLRPDAENAGDRAADYAAGRSAELAGEVTGNLREQLATAVDRANEMMGRGYSPREAMGEVNRRVREIAQKQAESAGTTETTAANSAGETEYKRQYEAETGISLLAIWRTERDGKVCKVCRGLEGATEDEFVDDYPSGPPAHRSCRCYLDWLRESLEGAEKSLKLRRFSSTQFNLPPALARRVQEIAAGIRSNDLAADGIETQPHITVKYGLHTGDHADVAEAVEGVPPVVVRFGALSIFPANEAQTQRGGEQFDVLKIEVEGEQLHELNAILSGALEHTDTHPTYQPHCTIAYLKPGRGEHYAATLHNPLDGREATFSRLQFSSKDGLKWDVELNSASQPVEA